MKVSSWFHDIPPNLHQSSILAQAKVAMVKRTLPLAKEEKKRIGEFTIHQYRVIHEQILQYVSHSPIDMGPKSLVL
jgi:hypothetical protein